jgi:uncharacterized membrane protein YedE/YeeE
MTKPIKVIGFLDFFGRWDASLAFVMLGAIAVYLVANCCCRVLAASWLATDFGMPKRKDVDAKLILGSAIFGVDGTRRVLSGTRPHLAFDLFLKGISPYASSPRRQVIGLFTLS